MLLTSLQRVCEHFLNVSGGLVQRKIACCVRSVLQIFVLCYSPEFRVHLNIYSQLQCASIPSLFCFLIPPWHDSLVSTVQFLRCHLPTLVISCMPRSSSDVISAAWMRNAVFQHMIFKPLSYAYLSSFFHSLFLKAFIWKVFLVLCFPPAILVPCEIIIISSSQFCLGHHRLLTSGRE